jgi:hypothetical protein
MSQTEICTKCFRPKHETATIGGMPIVSCVDFPQDRYPGGLILRDGIQWDCGCCKCLPWEPKPEILAAYNKPEGTSRHDFLSAIILKHWPDAIGYLETPGGAAVPTFAPKQKLLAET